MIWFSLAFAQQFVATPGAVRSYEVESWSMDRTKQHPYGTDWTVPHYQAWAGIVDCVMGEKRIELCTWRDARVYWAAGDTPETMHVAELQFHGQMELVWGPRGNLSSWDVRGKNREIFWKAAANAQLKELYHRSDVVYKDASIRDIGKSIEESLLKLTVGWLEVQWPKRPAPEWKPKSPITGPRWMKYGVASHKLAYRVLPDGRWVLKGKIVESTSNGKAIETAAAAVYVWEGDKLTTVIGDARHFSSSVRLDGHLRRRVELTQVTSETDPRPDHLPPALFPN